MTDRELLEAAAKAAGIPLAWGGPDGDMARRTDTWWSWHPIANDGDALRLAVKLNMLERHAFTDALHQENDRCNGDYYAATRRAIVRAAAAIGANKEHA